MRMLDTAIDDLVFNMFEKCQLCLQESLSLSLLLLPVCDSGPSSFLLQCVWVFPSQSVSSLYLWIDQTLFLGWMETRSLLNMSNTSSGMS